MTEKLKIIYYAILNKYFKHLLYLTIFFLRKKILHNIKYKELYSYKESKKKCKLYLISKKKLYLYFCKKKKIKNFKIKNKFLKYSTKLQNKKMGGGSDIQLIYNLIIIQKPMNIIEFGVASGWSTVSILEATKKNGFGTLESFDMPYFFQGSKKMIGNMVKKKYKNWRLFIGPQINYFNKIKKKYDFCHYDSDKSYQGRILAYDKIWKSLKKDAIFISDDIGDNVAFFDFCYHKKIKPFVVQYKNKYLGLISK